MSIVRVGLAETKNFSEGYDRIFAKKDQSDATNQKSDQTEQNSQRETKEDQAKK